MHVRTALALLLIAVTTTATVVQPFGGGGHSHRHPLAHAIVRVRGLRTRREFADALGVTEQTVYNWETGRTRPTRLVDAVELYKAGVGAHLLHPDLPPQWWPGAEPQPDSTNAI